MIIILSHYKNRDILHIQTFVYIPV